MKKVAILLITVLMNLSHAQQRGIQVKVVTQAGQSVDLYRESYALVIGVSDYTHGWPRIPNAVRDAREVGDELKKHGFHITLLENPTSARLKEGIEKFIASYGLDEHHRLLFYFAGHGHTVKKAYGSNVGYIVPSDAPDPNTDSGGFVMKAVSMERFNTYARDINARHVLYLFDSCFSGSIFALSRAAPEAITYKINQHVRQFITAGSEDEQVPDQSIFKSQFIAAIRGEADNNQDGYVTGTELGMFLQDKVVNYSRSAQHPQFGKIRDPQLDKGDFVFITKQAEQAAVLPSSRQRIDLSAYEAERDRAEARKQWITWQENMKTDFTKIESFDKDVNLSSESKSKLWQDFLTTYGDDNPFSDEDENLRKRANERKTYWEAVPVEPADAKPTVKMVEISEAHFSDIYPAMWFSPSDGTVTPITEKLEEPPEAKYECWVEPGDPEFAFLDEPLGSGMGFAVIGFGDRVFNEGVIPDDIEIKDRIDTHLQPFMIQERPVYYVQGKYGKCLIQIHRYDSEARVIKFKWRSVK